MPYFVFQINNHREYLCVSRFDAYRPARDDVRSRRAGSETRGVVDYRLVFAETESEGESLLRTTRERVPSDDD
ncbi:MAG: hypothetical protein DWQ08_05185 [Proteobacteria bacterium]|nr:MAG: hypothetical protein DWQ08_05185 [Pseudomonadota bacterium]